MKPRIVFRNGVWFWHSGTWTGYAATLPNAVSDAMAYFELQNQHYMRVFQLGMVH